MVTPVGLCFLQMSSRKGSLSAIAPKSMEFLVVAMEEAVLPNGLSGMRPSNTYKPSVWRWQNAKQALNKSLTKVVAKEDAF